ncbi:hypothetical protein CORC01_13530 [Colletotrichum orchidophilum]|uniref:Uncharacterized protein n=1 Tax=Colletotrichum orchidophilum TaxID=1209926 RepID=A0A1G4APT2_9PEZI|nr:uncharacterized protein CORC01_13530 [Colletotrichum orchidophilum]OHE91188.1 hypothetical protein CORC01_13530 [Colletotrichum orchidophilum]
MFLKPPSFHPTTMFFFCPSYHVADGRCRVNDSEVWIVFFTGKFLLISPSKPVNAMRLPNLDHVRDAMSNDVSRCLFCFFLDRLSRGPCNANDNGSLSRFSRPQCVCWLLISIL